MRALRLAKSIGALLLLVSLCLPISSCDTSSWSGPPTKTTSDSVVPTRSYHYAWTPARWAEPESYVSLFSFVWPAGAVLLSPRIRSRRLRTALWLAEPLLLAGPIYLLWVMTLFGDPEIGAFVAALGVTLYAFAWIAETVREVRDRLSRTNT